MTKIYVVGEAKKYAFFIKDFELTNDIEDSDVVLFTGGADVSPALYGEDNVGSYSDHVRDLYEYKEFIRAKDLNKPMLGICRGSQFLTVMNGGKLIQDVTNHGMSGTHSITNTNPFYNKQCIEITSTHHQMMYPFNLELNEYEIVAHSTERLSKHYITPFRDESVVPVEPEIVFYPKTRSLAVQGHPEYMDKDSDAVDYINWLITNYLL